MDLWGPYKWSKNTWITEFFCALFPSFAPQGAVFLVKLSNSFVTVRLMDSLLSWLRSVVHQGGEIYAQRWTNWIHFPKRFGGGPLHLFQKSSLSNHPHQTLVWVQSCTSFFFCFLFFLGSGGSCWEDDDSFFSARAVIKLCIFQDGKHLKALLLPDKKTEACAEIWQE